MPIQSPAVPVDGPQVEITPAPLSPPPAARCANCGATLLGPYCFACGQHVADFHRSIWRLLAGFVDNAFGWDNKLLLSLRALLGRPGLLTREFLQGHRVRYVDPLRQFLVVSAICLAALQFVPSKIITFTQTPDKAPVQKAENEAGKSTQLVSRARGWMEHVAASVDARIKREGPDRFTAEIWRQSVQRASWVTLAVLPIFALLLRGIYRGQDSYYFGHLVFSLHYHTFLNLFSVVYLSLVGFGLDKSSKLLSIMALIFTFWPPLYLFSALRRVYGEGWMRTLLKTLVLGFLHSVILLLGIVALEVTTVILSVQ